MTVSEILAIPTFIKHQKMSQSFFFNVSKMCKKSVKKRPTTVRDQLINM